MLLAQTGGLLVVDGSLASLFQQATLYRVESGFQSGIYNMALDEALLEFIRVQSTPILLVRTYQWQEPTLSLGVNQAVRDLNFLLSFYADANGKPPQSLVRRPTGGRAILHGEDISYAFLTNEPAILKQNLNASYCVFARLVQSTLEGLSLNVSLSGNPSSRDYTRSPVCFETHTHSDLVASNGKKLSGSAQLRRAGGLLQHGAAFLRHYNVTPAAFSDALFETVAEATGKTWTPFPMEAVQLALATLQESYRKESSEIFANASNTSGSHLEPASS